MIAFEKSNHKFTAKAFGYAYIAFMEKSNRSTEEFRKKLTELLPIHLHKMNPIQITRCLEVTI
jgi:hypothetical protein